MLGFRNLVAGLLGCWVAGTLARWVAGFFARCERGVANARNCHPRHCVANVDVALHATTSHGEPFCWNSLAVVVTMGQLRDRWVHFSGGWSLG
jgi:hypothetical protein